MAVLSLIPVLGAWLVWGPVALYLLATGEVAKAALMAAFGAGVIGLIDNILRPILVGRSSHAGLYRPAIHSRWNLALD
ncbi:AI-2E family transporter [Serratia marcescens]|uniref:AI-2E family transporter n=1 Tax=Serratia marcescens TaxID=615 RepID=A0A939NQ07_SERMA|nr:AI-2E family transporter [Serratia marcescens]